MKSGRSIASRAALQSFLMFGFYAPRDRSRDWVVLCAVRRAGILR